MILALASDVHRCIIPPPQICIPGTPWIVSTLQSSWDKARKQEIGWAYQQPLRRSDRVVCQLMVKRTEHQLDQSREYRQILTYWSSAMIADYLWMRFSMNAETRDEKLSLGVDRSTFTLAESNASTSLTE